MAMKHHHSTGPTIAPTQRTLAHARARNIAREREREKESARKLDLVPLEKF